MDLYLTNNLTGGSILEKITDSAAYNATISDSTASTLYTAPAGDLLRGVSAAPVPEPMSFGLFAVGGALLVLRRRPAGNLPKLPA